MKFDQLIAIMGEDKVKNPMYAELLLSDLVTSIDVLHLNLVNIKTNIKLSKLLTALNSTYSEQTSYNEAIVDKSTFLYLVEMDEDTRICNSISSSITKFISDISELRSKIYKWDKDSSQEFIDSIFDELTSMKKRYSGIFNSCRLIFAKHNNLYDEDNEE